MKKIFLLILILLSSCFTYAQLTIYSSLNAGGTSATCVVRTIYKGSSIPNGLNNSIKSISLNQGFMATLAENEDGTGERFTYIASQSSINVNLAFVMQNKISFIRVLRLPPTAVRKKGAGAIINADEIAQNVTWFYDWGFRDTTTPTREFVPMAWGKGHASEIRIDSVLNKDSVTHYLGFNEPNHDSQANMYVSEALPLFKNMQRAGYRMGSPAGTEEAYQTWVDSFHTEANKQKLNVDFICVHWYDWGNWTSTSNANPTAAQVLSRLQTYIDNVYNLYRKPIWITEFNANVNRSAAINKAFMELALPWLDSDPRVERYAFFFEDHFPVRNPDGTTTAIGQSYANHNSVLAYSQNIVDTRPVFPETVLAGWNTSALNASQSNSTTTTFAPTTLNSGITATQPFTAGSGVVSFGGGVAGFWGGITWSTTTSTQGITDNKFLSFKLQSVAGRTLNYRTISDINIRVNTDGPDQFLLQYQINNGSFVNIATRTIPTVTTLTSTTLNSIDLSGISALQNVPSSSTVTFRIVPFSASSTGSFALGNGTSNNDNDFEILGSFVEDSSRVYTSPGNALQFDGTNDFVTIADANNLDLVNNYTLEAWIRPTSFSSQAGIISKSQTNTSNGYFLASNTTSPFTGLSFDGLQTDNGILETGKWYHVAAVKSGSTRTLYINGVSVSLTGTAVTTAANIQALTIGMHNGQSPKYFAGAIDEVRIWNIARAEADILRDRFNTISPNVNNLVDYFNFDNGIAAGTNTGLNSLQDQTSSTNNGTLTNFALSGTSSNWVESYAFLIPEAIQETNKTSTSFTANWLQPDATSLTNITNYWLDVSTNTNFSTFVSGYNGLSVSGISQNVTGLTPNITYYYRVRANKTAIPNQGGNSNVITVTPLSSDADLTALTLNFGTLSPTFATNTTAYSVTYLNNRTSITVTPTKDHINATIQVNINGGSYVTVNSGTASVSLPLIVGVNTINVLVTAEDLVTTKTYVISATREVNTWIGSASTNYNTASNWTGNAVPTINDDVLIPEPSLSNNRSPLINGNNHADWLSFARNITINNGATLSITNNSDFSRYGILRLSGNIINNGTLSVTSFSLQGGTIEYAGTTPQTIAANTFNGNSVYNLIINNPAGVTLNGALTVNGRLTPTLGTLTTNSFLTLSSIAGRTAFVTSGAGLISGNVTVQRFIPGKRAWRLLTAPLTSFGGSPVYLNNSWQTNTHIVGPSGTGLDPAPAYNMQQYINNNWVNVTNTHTTELFGSSATASNKAFAMFIIGDRSRITSNTATNNFGNVTLSATGTLLQGVQSFNLGNLATNQFALVGNPYACPVDFDAVFNTPGTTNINRTFYTWNPTLSGTGGYVTISWNGSSYDISPSNSQTQIIQSGQAFFVQATTNGATTVVFDETDKITTNNNAVFGIGNGTNDKLNINLQKLDNGNLLTLDGVMASFGASFSKQILVNEDADKLFNNEEGITIRRENKSLSIERRPFITNTNDTIFLGLNRLTPNTNYTLNLIPQGWDASMQAFLVDRLLSTETPINLQSSNHDITISSPNTLEADRWMIVFRGTGNLPNNKLSLVATKRDKDVQLTWNIANEQGVKEYELQRSIDGTNFQAINNQVASNNGEYNNLDTKANNGINYYRVKMTMQNDDIRFSNIITINLQHLTSNIITVFPNPIKGNSINLQLAGLEKGLISFRIIDMQGKVLQNNSINYNGSTSVQSIPLNSNYANGNYQLQVISKKATQTINILINKN